MLKRLTLERFKSFERAELEFGPLTFIVGPNASGKSNLREALRFLHGVFARLFPGGDHRREVG